jgi:uncharacterized protein DUF4386
MRKTHWLVPLLGAVFVVLAVIAFILMGEPPSVDDNSADEIVDWYVDNHDEAIAGALLIGVGAVGFIFFANYLRMIFRETSASATILVGAAIFVVGGAIDSTLLLATAEAADDIDPTAVQALQAFWDNDFLPIAIGLSVFLFSLAVSLLRTSIVPRWLGWVALVLAVLSITPVGFFAFPVTGLLILVLSIMFTVRERRASAPPPGAPPPAPAVQ